MDWRNPLAKTERPPTEWFENLMRGDRFRSVEEKPTFPDPYRFNGLLDVDDPNFMTRPDVRVIRPDFFSGDLAEQQYLRRGQGI